MYDRSIVAEIQHPPSTIWWGHAEAVPRDDRGTRDHDKEIPKEASVARRPLKVLIVDDDAYVTGYMQLFLRAYGYDVEVATSGAAALVLPRERYPDLIVLDLRLPDLDGITVLQKIGYEIGTPVIVLTGYPSDASRAETMLLGAVAYLTKPVVGQRLLDAIAEAAARIDAGPGRSATVRQDDSKLPESVINLVTLLGELVTSAKTSATQTHIEDGRETLVLGLLRVLVDPDVTVPVFTACGAAFRAVQSRATPLVRPLLEGIHRPILGIARPLEPYDSRVVQAIARLKQAGADVLQLQEADLARELSVDPAHLGRLLHRHTGLGFRKWRWGFALRPVVRALAETDHTVKSIAFDAGFREHSNATANLDGLFHRLLGVSPSDFRFMARTLTRGPAHRNTIPDREEVSDE